MGPSGTVSAFHANTGRKENQGKYLCFPASENLDKGDTEMHCRWGGAQDRSG